MSQQEHDESLVGGRHARQRRSAATKNKAWSSLMSSKNKGEDYDEEEVPTPTPRSTSRSAPRSKKSKLEMTPDPPVQSRPTPKMESLEKKLPTIPVQAPRLFRTAPVPQSVSMNEITNGTKSTAAFGKNDIDNIQQEMFKTYRSNESEGFSDSEEAEDSLQDLLDDEDEDFVAKPKRTYTKRTTTASIRGIRGGRGAIKNQPFNPRPSFVQQSNMVVSRTTEAIGQRPAAPRPFPLRYASSTAPNENRPFKMVVLRQPGKQGESAAFGSGEGPRMPMTISSMSVPTKEIDEINRKFGERVVTGDSVHKFNDLINTLVGEIKCMAEDRERMVRNHQELVEQMSLNHSAQIDIKDSRIGQLNNFVNKLQAQITQMTVKLQASFSQHESSEKEKSSAINNEFEEEEDEEDSEESIAAK